MPSPTCTWLTRLSWSVLDYMSDGYPGQEQTHSGTQVQAMNGAWPECASGSQNSATKGSDYFAREKENNHSFDVAPPIRENQIGLMDARPGRATTPALAY